MATLELAADLLLSSSFFKILSLPSVWEFFQSVIARLHCLGWAAAGSVK